jgi:hypothetical protein
VDFHLLLFAGLPGAPKVLNYKKSVCRDYDKCLRDPVADRPAARIARVGMRCGGCQARQATTVEMCRDEG